MMDVMDMMDDSRFHPNPTTRSPHRPTTPSHAPTIFFRFSL